MLNSVIIFASCLAAAGPIGQAAKDLGELIALPFLAELDPAEPLSHLAELLGHLAVHDRNAVADRVDLGWQDPEGVVSARLCRSR